MKDLDIDQVINTVKGFHYILNEVSDFKVSKEDEIKIYAAICDILDRYENVFFLALAETGSLHAVIALAILNFIYFGNKSSFDQTMIMNGVLSRAEKIINSAFRFDKENYTHLSEDIKNLFKKNEDKGEK